MKISPEVRTDPRDGALNKLEQWLKNGYRPYLHRTSGDQLPLQKHTKAAQQKG
jgi:hypothetical protein